VAGRIGRPQARVLAALDHQDVQLNLWVLFGEFCDRHSGQHGGRTDIALSETTAMTPDQFYYHKSREQCMIRGVSTSAVFLT